MPPAAEPSLGQKALQTFATRMIVAAFSVLGGILVARALGPTGKGAYSAVQTLVSVPVALAGGIGTAITFSLAREKLSVRDILPALGAIFAALTLFCVAGVVVYALLYGWSPAAIACAAAMPAAIVVAWQQGFYVGLGRLRTMNTQTLLQGASTFMLLALACMVLRLGTAGALGVWVLCNYAVAAAVVWDAVRTSARDAGPPEARLSLGKRLKAILHFGSQSSLNAFLGLLNYRVDSLILVGLLGLAPFGIYSIAVNLGEMLFLILRPVNVAVGGEIGSSSHERSARITADTVRLGFLVAFAFCIVAYALGPPLIHIVYGGRFDGAEVPLRYLLPGILVFGSAGTFANYFLFQLGRPVMVTWINAVMIVVQGAACFALVPRFGMAGAAAGSSVTYILGAIVNTALFCRASSVPAREVWLPTAADVGRLWNVLARSLGRRFVQQPAGRVLAVTGAAGEVATLLRPLLRTSFDLRLTDRVRAGRLERGETFVRADLKNLGSLRRIFRGADAVLHLGGIAKEAAFDDIVDSNVHGMHAVLEAARLENVRRIVFAGTGHVTGFYPRSTFLDETAPMRPDTLYAVSKGFGELLSRFYADKYGMEIVCIRIGHVSERPRYKVDRHIWISPRDLAQLVGNAIDHPGVHCDVVYGVSANARRWWSLKRARGLGYEPADGIEQTEIGEIVQGESFAARDFRGSVSKLLS
ncbi:MAG TPA: NAD-dependent epimerase/dehydratase family protein [Candidatus Baltobacteraceae bacterium]|nr:NAD-dependent epimerase/dehydratase family protein [Candidatus Baltobacteraceae bacterium]